jgi:enoyl-CoA hydratase
VSAAVVRYEVDGRVARITLDRPERGNAITLQLVRELAECVERADLDPAVHVMLLAGSGSGFCGGYDLLESAEGMGAREGSPASGGTGGTPGVGGGPGPAAPWEHMDETRGGSPLDGAVVAANHDPRRT